MKGALIAMEGADQCIGVNLEDVLYGPGAVLPIMQAQHNLLASPVWPSVDFRGFC